MGGSKKKDTFDNLIAVCRECHLKYGDKKQYKEFLKPLSAGYYAQFIYIQKTLLSRYY